FIHHLTLAEFDLDHLAIDPAAHGYGAIRLHGAETVQIHREVRVLDRLRRDRRRRRTFGLALAGAAGPVTPAHITEERNGTNAQHACQGAKPERKWTCQKNLRGHRWFSAAPPPLRGCQAGKKMDVSKKSPRSPLVFCRPASSQITSARSKSCVPDAVSA